jgi:CBS-domain-containing membrane protein
MTMKIAEVMTQRPRAVTAQMTVREAARLMDEEDVGSLPVVDEGERLIGIVTDRDVAVRVVGRGLDSDTTVVGDVASIDVAVLTPDHDLDDALRLMAREQVRRVPIVVRENQLVGPSGAVARVVSRSGDFCRAHATCAHREWFLAEREAITKRAVGGALCPRSRLFSCATGTTAVRGSIRVGVFKKRFEPQESNTRKSSPDTAIRFRSCVEAPAIGYLPRQGRRSYRRSNSPTAPPSAIPGQFWLGCASSESEETP